MNKRRWSRGEKWMIAISCGVCLPGLLLGWIYERQNELPPTPAIVAEVPPANNAFDVLMGAIPLVARPRRPSYSSAGCKSTGVVVDREFDCGSWKLPYTPQYNRDYPLKNKRAFLQANANVLKLWRASLSLPMYVPDGLPRGKQRLWRQSSVFDVLVRTQARACWQQGDNDGALDWLLLWHRDLCRQTLSFYNGRAHPVPLELLLSTDDSRREVGDELKWLLPFLNAAQLQRASLRLQQNRMLVPSRAEAAKEGKRRWMTRVYRACATNSFKGFDANSEVSWVKSVWMQRFRWANKKAGFTRIEKQWDWIIAGEEAPLQTTETQTVTQPDFEGNDPFRLVEPWRSNLRRVPAASGDASELVLLTAMAVRSFALEHGRNPRDLKELVPRYLHKVEVDPFAPKQPLRYSPKPKSYSQLQWGNPIYTLPLPKDAIAFPSGAFPPNTKPIVGYHTFRLTQKLPFVLYSVGKNGRDDGGLYDGGPPQPVGPGKDDIVATPEWFKLPK